MIQDFIDDLIEVVEVKKTVNKSSVDYKATKSKTFAIAGVEVQSKRVVSEEARRKISEGNKGKIISEETRKKISEAKKRAMTEEVRRKMSESGKARIFSEQHKKNMSAARIAGVLSVMTPHGKFVSRRALIQKITNDGILNATDKLREWFKLYPNDYYYIKKIKTK